VSCRSLLRVFALPEASSLRRGWLTPPLSNLLRAIIANAIFLARFGVPNEGSWFKTQCEVAVFERSADFGLHTFPSIAVRHALPVAANLERLGDPRNRAALAIILDAAIHIAFAFKITFKGDWNEITVAVEINAEVTIIDCDTLVSINGFALIEELQSLPAECAVRFGERTEAKPQRQIGCADGIRIVLFRMDCSAPAAISAWPKRVTALNRPGSPLGRRRSDLSP
jgi:hypothetical protein